MVAMQNQSFLMKIKTSEPNISMAWKALISRHTLQNNDDDKKWRVFFAPSSWKKYISVCALPGKNAILIKVTGSSDKAQSLISQVRMALLMEVWEIFQVTAQDMKPLNQQLFYFRIFSGIDVHLEEVKLEENSR